MKQWQKEALKKINQKIKRIRDGKTPKIIFDRSEEPYFISFWKEEREAIDNNISARQN